MNSLTTIAFSAATINIVMAAIHTAISRAPGWKIARVFAVIAFTAGLYSVLGVVLSIDGLSDSTYLAMARLAYVVITVHSTAWLVYAYGGSTGSPRAVPVGIRVLIVLGLILGVFLALTNLHLETQIAMIAPDWFGAYWRHPAITRTGVFFALALIAMLGLAFSEIARRVLRGEKELRWHLVFFLVFIGFAVEELLVVNHVLSFLPLLDVGFVLITLPTTLRVVTRLIRDARRLESLSNRLASEVEERTAERDYAQRELLEAERLAALGRLAAGVGHELNNPLAYLKLALHELEEQFTSRPRSVELKAPLQAAQDGAFRIQRVVDGLRDCLGAEATEKHAPVDLHEVVSAASNVARHRLLKLARLETSLEPVSRVMGDEPRLVQAVVNLLVNASQAVADDGTGVVSVSTSTRSDGRVSLTVEDNGPGIPEELLDRLTEPHFTTRSKGGGLGLGLFVTRGIVASHDGSLTFDSAPGRGTRVRIDLPAIAPETAASSLDHARPQPGAARDSRSTGWLLAPAPRRAVGGRLLILDDEPMILGTLERLLRRRWEVTCLSDSQEALRLLDLPETKFDVVICDLMMPGISGMELAGHLARTRPDLRRRMLFLTGGAVTPSAEEFLARTDVRSLAKPVSVAQLEAALDEVMSQHGQRPDSRDRWPRASGQ